MSLPTINYTPQYIGSVRRNTVFEGLCNLDPSVAELYELFKRYWLCGHIKHFGKDIIFSRSDIMRDSHLRHVHYDAGNYIDESSDQNKSGKQSIWDKWQNFCDLKSPDDRHDKINRFTTPTSDAFLVYFVTSDRTAIVTHFIGDNAHYSITTSDFIEDCEDIEYRLSATNKFKPMDTSEEPFDPKYLISRQLKDAI